jgi:hypothetical protein
MCKNHLKAPTHLVFFVFFYCVFWRFPPRAARGCA